MSPGTKEWIEGVVDAKRRRQAGVDVFIEIYRPALLAAVEAHPSEYCYGAEMALKVVEKMREAMVVGYYNHDGRAMRVTCEVLGIKHTRKAIEAYIDNV